MQLKSPTMYKQSSSKTHRSKGIKVKHLLQICLLLAVCFWLIYQVKHSHDKKKEFDEHDAKISLDSVRKDNVVKLGRKDLHPLKEGTVVESDKHEEVEEEEVEETTVEEEENKHEGEEKENITEAEDENGEGRGGMEEEVDDHDQDKSDKENGQEDEFVDEEKEQENDDEPDLHDKDSEDNTELKDTGDVSQKHDNLGGTTNRHEAREENYKADDASSAVTLDTQITSNGNETVVLRKQNEQAEVNSIEPRDFSDHIDGGDVGQNASVNVEDSQTANEGHLGTTTNDQNQTTISNSSVSEVSKDLITRENSTEVKGKVQDVIRSNRNGTLLEQNEDKKDVEEHEISSESSKIEISVPNLEDNSTLLVNSKLQNFNLTISSESKSTDLGDSHTDGVTKYSNSETKYDGIPKAETSSIMMENGSSSENTEDDNASRINERLDKSKSENSYDKKLEIKDSSDSKFSLEEKDVRTDLETLPDMKIVGGDSEDDTAE